MDLSTMDARVKEKAEELAATILASPQVAKFSAAEKAMFQDRTAAGILQDFYKLQQEIFQLEDQGKELTDQHHAAIKEMESKMEGNKLIQDYVAAQKEVEQLLDQVNFIITTVLSGEEEHGCSSCGGGECGPGCSVC